MFACINIRTKHCDIYKVKGETEVAGINVFSVKSSCKEKKVEVLWNSGFFFYLVLGFLMLVFLKCHLARHLTPLVPLMLFLDLFQSRHSKMKD